MQDFIGFLTSEKRLYFSKEQQEPDVAGIGVPQGGVLSPFLYSLALRTIKDAFPHEVKIVMYADDILIYSTSESIEIANNSIKNAFNSLSEWLKERGLDISLPKTQYIIFSKSREVLRVNNSITLENSGQTQTLYSAKSIKYLGTIIDRSEFF